MISSVAFPSVSNPPSAHPSSSKSHSSALSVRQATALEVCDIVYGTSDPPPWEVLERLYESNAVYENPLVTATSREIISDIYSLSCQWSRIDVPRPLAALLVLLRVSSHLREEDVLLRAMKAWTEIGDVAESESFDGHRRCVVEHTLHVLWIPGIHSGRSAPTSRSGIFTPASESSLDLTTRSTATPVSSLNHPQPSIAIPGSGLSLPSPLHFTFHITTRLDFNDAGRITHHRDLWDVRDVFALFPGGAFAQWFASRVAAQSLSFAYNVSSWVFGPLRKSVPVGQASQDSTGRRTRDGDIELGEVRPPAMSPARAYTRSALSWFSSGPRREGRR